MSPDLSAAVWRTSSYSGGNGGECVEVAFPPTATAVRDSKNPTGPALVFTPEQWGSFVDSAKIGAFDLS